MRDERGFFDSVSMRSKEKWFVVVDVKNQEYTSLGSESRGDI